MNLEQFFDKYWPTILAGILGFLLKDYIKKFLHWLVEVILWFLGFLGIHVLLLRRFKKSLLTSFRETRIGYRYCRIDLEHNYITLKLGQEEYVHFSDRGQELAEKPEGIDALLLLAAGQENKYTVVLGHPGAGKTTLLQHLLLRYASKQKDANAIPIFIPLRELKEQSLFEYMKSYFKNHRFIRFGYIKRQLKRGKCLVMFDGLDEVVEKQRLQIIKQIEEFSTEYPSNRLIVTSRIEGYIPDVLPPTFREREILDLDAVERKNFILGLVSAEANPERLINQIESQPGLRRLAVRPMTLALLTFVYQESASRSLPENRIRIYEKCIDLMFEDRDKSRGIYEYRNKYPAEVKVQILRKVSLTFMQQNKQSFQREELKQEIEEAIRSADLPQIDIVNLIDEFAQANGIFRHKTRNEYEFAHLTFQEYFAALEVPFLAESQREQLIKDKLPLDSWREVFLFFVQCCDSPGKLIERALQCENIWFAVELALSIIARVPVELRSKLLNKTIDQVLCHRKTLEPFQFELICDLSKGGNEHFTFEKLKTAPQILEKYSLLELKQWDSQFHIIGRENIDQKHPGMVYVPSGEFLYQTKEKISLPGFWIGIFPVTNGAFKAFVDAAGLSTFNDTFQKEWEAEQIEARIHHPVRCVTWNEAARYCNWLSRQENLELTFDEQSKAFSVDKNGYRLPAEQEWEKAVAWDDFEKKARIFPWGDEFNPSYCNNSVKNRSKDTSDIRKFKQGRCFYGCYDMAGNIWEWTASQWSEKDEELTVFRGGSWNYGYEYYFRCAVRGGDDPRIRGLDLGFRVVRSAQF